MLSIFYLLLGVTLAGCCTFAVLDFLYEKTDWRIFEIASFPFMFFFLPLLFLLPFALVLFVANLLSLVF